MDQSLIRVDLGLAVVGAIIGGIVYLVLRRRRESATRPAGHENYYGAPVGSNSYHEGRPAGEMVASWRPDKGPAPQAYAVPPPPSSLQAARNEGAAPRVYGSWFPSRLQEEGMVHEAPHAEIRREAEA